MWLQKVHHHYEKNEVDDAVEYLRYDISLYWFLLHLLCYQIFIWNLYEKKYRWFALLLSFNVMLISLLRRFSWVLQTQSFYAQKRWLNAFFKCFSLENITIVFLSIPLTVTSHSSVKTDDVCDPSG